MNRRMRVFAGPNGSGKSSIIKAIRSTEVKKGKKLDFGIYVNADDIAQELYTKGLNFSSFDVFFDLDEFEQIVKNSGLVNQEFPYSRLIKCIRITKNQLSINKKEAEKKEDSPYERIAQILADFIRKILLKEGKKFSFETVFSHSGKVEIIKEAKDLGYKVYLYFVSTEDPTINIHRVKEVRVPQKGHDVPEDKIITRYYRSMNLMYDAAQHCYQAYFFDNSKEGKQHNLFGHFKLNSNGEKVWSITKNEEVPEWFKHYYSAKIR
jgi:predicted ABC-type ATPase